MFHAALHLMTSLPVHTHSMLSGMSHHLAMWQLPDNFKQPEPLSSSAPSDWKPYNNNSFRPEAGGCVDSPEAATLVLMAVGALGVAAGSWFMRKRARA